MRIIGSGVLVAVGFAVLAMSTAPVMADDKSHNRQSLGTEMKVNEGQREELRNKRQPSAAGKLGEKEKESEDSTTEKVSPSR